MSPEVHRPTFDDRNQTTDIVNSAYRNLTLINVACVTTLYIRNVITSNQPVVICHLVNVLQLINTLICAQLHW